MHKRFLVALLAVLAGVLIPALAGAQAHNHLYHWGQGDLTPFCVINDSRSTRGPPQQARRTGQTSTSNPCNPSYTATRSSRSWFIPRTPPPAREKSHG
jgi:hypothetical protein